MNKEEIDPKEIPEVVPEKLKNSFDYKAFLAIAILVISYQHQLSDIWR